MIQKINISSVIHIRINIFKLPIGGGFHLLSAVKEIHDRIFEIDNIIKLT